MKSESGIRAFERFGTFFGLGALFEVLLIIAAWGLPGSNLAIEITNFCLLVHYPWILFVDAVGDGPFGTAFFIVVGFLAMATIWGCLFLLLTRLVRRLATRLNRIQKAGLGLLIGVAALMLLADAVVSALPSTPISFTSSPDINAVVDANNAFALDLYHHLSQQPGNLLFSPFSISSALAMTSAGARGQTEAEMTNTLHLRLPPERLHPAFQALLRRMDRVQRWNRIILKCANSLWCQKDCTFAPAYLKVVHENYFAEALPVDFMHAPVAAADEINRWIDSRTGHKVPGAISSDKLTPDTRLVLGDAIYFKGKWLHQFKVGDTKPAEFHIRTNKTVTVPMMSQSAEFKHALSEDASVEMLELPYSGQDLSMVIFLPTKYDFSDNGHNDIFDLEQQLTPDNLRAWLAELDHRNPHKTYVGLPRFTTTSDFNLARELMALGMPSAFNDNADFSGMNGTTNLFLTDVIHKTFVKVDESGTEAAAITLVLVKTKSMRDSFYVDRPFIFLIRDNGSGSILFLGRIIDPTK